MKAKTLTTLNGVNKAHITVFNGTVTVIGQIGHIKNDRKVPMEATAEVNMTLQEIKTPILW